MVTMILIVLLATALRLHDLSTDSLWGDEIYEALNAQRDLSSILSNSPLAVRLTMTHIFMLIGDQDFLFRFSYAVVSILAVAVMYKVGQALFDDVTGLVAAFLLAISPYHIQYSQEGRSYSWTVLLVLASFYCLYRALQDNQSKHWVGFAFITALSLNNHMTAGSVVAAEIAFATLVLFVERFSGTARRREHQPENRSRPSGFVDLARAWWHRLRTSRGAMLALSSLAGVSLFLIFSGQWFSYLSSIGVSTAGSDASNGGAVLRISRSYLERLLSQFGAGSGVALALFGGAFAIGLVSCAVQRKWRQLLLAPLWILTPLLFLTQVSSSVAYYSRYLITILPVYLLFIAKGITSIGKLIGRYGGWSRRTKRFAGVTWLILSLGMITWLSVGPIQAYYQGHKEDWKGVATLLAEQAEPGEPIVQLQIWPTDPLRYYMRGQSGYSEVLLADLLAMDDNDLPASVWWVIHVGQRGTRPSPLPSPEELGGSEFDAYSFYSHPFKSPALVHRKTPIADRADFLRLAAKLILVQAQSDSWSYFEGHLKRLSQVTDLLEASPMLSECPPELSDPERYNQAAREQSRNAQRQEALDSTLKAMALYEMLYPGHGRPHDSVLEALHSLGDSARESGHRACSMLFYSRAADARKLDVQADPDSIDHWQILAEALVKAGRHEEAVVAYEQLIELAPGRWEYLAGLARSYRASGQHEKGIDKLEQAVELAPAEPQLRRRLADSYFLDGRMAEAAVAFHQILEASPGDIEARLGLALAHEALGRKSEAIHELQTLIEIDPDHWLVPEAKERLEALEQ